MSDRRPTRDAHVYVSQDEQRRRERRRRKKAQRMRRRRLLLIVGAAMVVVAAVVAVRALTGGGRAPSGSPAAATGTTKPTSHRSSAAVVSAAAAHTVITIGWVGDTTPGSNYGMPPDAGRALFGSMRPLLSKPDLMIANLEGTYSTGGAVQVRQRRLAANCYAFQAPPSYARALAWSGIDLVNIANNHSHDYLGAACCRRAPRSSTPGCLRRAAGHRDARQRARRARGRDGLLALPVEQRR